MFFEVWKKAIIVIYQQTNHNKIIPSIGESCKQLKTATPSLFPGSKAVPVGGASGQGVEPAGGGGHHQRR